MSCCDLQGLVFDNDNADLLALLLNSEKLSVDVCMYCIHKLRKIVEFQREFKGIKAEIDDL